MGAATFVLPWRLALRTGFPPFVLCVGTFIFANPLVLVDCGWNHAIQRSGPGAGLCRTGRSRESGRIQATRSGFGLGNLSSDVCLGISFCVQPVVYFCEVRCVSVRSCPGNPDSLALHQAEALGIQEADLCFCCSSLDHLRATGNYILVAMDEADTLPFPHDFSDS